MRFVNGVTGGPGGGRARLPGAIWWAGVARGVALAGALGMCVGVASGQTDPAPRAYDVCSAKPSGESGYSGSLPGVGYHVTNVPAVALVVGAFGVTPQQVLGLPDWATGDRYDVDCRDTEPSAQKQPLAARTQAGLQALLNGRFAFRSHVETIRLPVAALTIRSNGLKLLEAESGARGAGRFGRGFLKVEAWTVDELCTALTGVVGERVTDQTGLTARYDFDLRWRLEDQRDPESGMPASTFAEAPLPLLPDALREQAGLTLKRSVADAKAVVVDHIERPTAN